MTKKQIDLESIAQHFINVYESTLQHNPEAATRVKYVESLLDNSCRLIRAEFDKLYDKTFRQNIENELREKYQVEYRSAKNEAMIEAIQYLLERIE